MAVHARYNSWYIFLPSSAKQEREMRCLLVNNNNGISFSVFSNRELKKTMTATATSLNKRFNEKNHARAL